jgi:cytochrome P450
VYLVSHPDAVQHVLRDKASHYHKGVLWQALATLQGQGLLTSDGALWRRQHQLAQQAFRPRQLALSGSIMAEEARAVVQDWRQAAGTGKPVNVAAWMHRLTFRIVGRALLGIAPAALDEVGWQLQAVGQRLSPHLTARLPRPWTLPSWVPTPSRQRFRRAVAVYNTIAQQVITARRQALRHNTTAATDVLAMLIVAHDNTAGGALTEQQLRDEVITFIGAGVETAAQALSWTWYLLARAPEVAERVQAELAAVLGTRPPMADDLPRQALGMKRCCTTP